MKEITKSNVPDGHLIKDLDNNRFIHGGNNHIPIIKNGNGTGVNLKKNN